MNRPITTWPLWVMCSLPFAIFLLLSIGNTAILIANFRDGKHRSLFGIAGGICGMLACLVCPFRWVKDLWWVPLILDPGSLPMIVWAQIRDARERTRQRQSSNPNPARVETPGKVDGPF